ncbi:MAG: hypothetical protein ABW252_20495 [Polyangiales bacterium]
MNQISLLPVLPMRAKRASTRRPALVAACVGLLAVASAACGDEATRDEAPAGESTTRDVDDAPASAPRAPAAQVVEAPAAAAPAPSADATASGGTSLASLNVSITTEPPKVAPWFKVFRPADLKAVGRPLPVVAWANGGCFRSEFTWDPLFKRWAAAGIIVLALTANPKDGLLGALTASNVTHHKALIEWAVKENETEGSPYQGLIDTKRLVLAGNSCGGVTALGAAAQEPRASAVFVLSGSSALAATDRNVMGKIKVPVGYVVGGKEDIAGANALADYEALSAGVPGLLVSRAQGDHVFVSTTPEVLAEVAKISLDWLDLALFRTPSAKATLKSPTVCTGCKAGTWIVKDKNLETLAP